MRVRLELGMGLTPTQLKTAPSAASAAAIGPFSRRTHSPFFSSQPAGLGDGLNGAEAGEADEQKQKGRQGAGGQRSES